MNTGNVRRQDLERCRSLREREKPSNSSLSKHLQKVYPIGIHKSTSSLTLSSLSLSQCSNDSSLNSCLSRWDRKVQASLHGLGSLEKREASVADVGKGSLDSRDGNLKRCHWITKDQVYVLFHDERWGVPVYDDSQLFELLALSGMLMDQNWTEILSRRELYREVFSRFDANVVTKMEEKKIIEISSNKKLMLAESRVRCIVDNARGILKIVKEFGSFSSYLWGYMNYRPNISRYRYPRNIPLRTPKAEAISKDLIRRGFRFVGPVIVYSFMQAAGMTIDHLIDCFRFVECVNLAENPCSLTNTAK
ncbi:DNA glycosylase superfamily protein isoform X2 [Tasmannia lanceolata]|uniref:DNA glycosylase superfamily protein isoform X2 n=1 Tax=Tasmannia lanceolata TaxID=3420 RepID=UPI00406335BF